MGKPTKPFLIADHDMELVRSQGSVQMIEVAVLQLDGGTQTRASLDEEAIRHYADIMQERRDAMPSIAVFKEADGRLWIGDGFHRIHAAQTLGWSKIKAKVRAGTRLDAFKYSLRANVLHGVRRTNADKRRSVELVFAEETLCGESDRAIAKLCGVGNQLVGDVRSDLIANGHTELCDSHNSLSPTKRRGLDGKMRSARGSKHKACSATKASLPVDEPNDRRERSASGIESMVPICRGEGEDNADVKAALPSIMTVEEQTVQSEQSNLVAEVVRDTTLAEGESMLDSTAAVVCPGTSGSEGPLMPPTPTETESFLLLDGSRLPSDEWDHGPIPFDWAQEKIDSLKRNNEQQKVEKRRDLAALRAEQFCLIELVRTANRLLHSLESAPETPLAILNFAVLHLCNYTNPRCVFLPSDSR